MENYTSDYMFYAYTYTGNYQTAETIQPSSEVKNSVPEIIIDTKKRDSMIDSLDLESIRNKARAFRSNRK